MARSLRRAVLSRPAGTAIEHRHTVRPITLSHHSPGRRLVTRERPGLTTPSHDSTTGGQPSYPRALLRAGIPIVEHLTGLEPLVGASFRFFAVPPTVKGMGTFPVRAFAMTEAV